MGNTEFLNRSGKGNGSSAMLLKKITMKGTNVSKLFKS